MKKLLKILGIVLLSLLLIVGLYVAYVFLTYSRIEDKLELTPDVIGQLSENVEVGQEYTIVSYNIGFGAYTSDYSFFMDGGKSSWATSEEDLLKNLNSIGDTINSINPDFVVLQEVDTNGTRTYHVNEYEILRNMLGDGAFVFAQNYHSSFLMYPLNEPHGANESGILTYSSFAVDNSIRRSLPISTSVSKIVDLDRCYSITRIPVSNGKLLCIYNVHLSAYGTDDSVRNAQLNMLIDDLSSDYEEGNYIICGGDFNQNLRDEYRENVPSWAQRFPSEELPSGINLAYVNALLSDISHDTCRNADAPYDPATAFTVTVDGFIVSDNVIINSYTNVCFDYAYSDHDPVVMNFTLVD